MNWVIILIGVIAVFVVSRLIDFRSVKHRVFAVTLILLLLFVYVTFTQVTQENNISLKSTAGVLTASKVYVSWLGQSLGNVKSLTGQAINMDWIPEVSNSSVKK